MSEHSDTALRVLATLAQKKSLTQQVRNEIMACAIVLADEIKLLESPEGAPDAGTGELG